MTPATPVVRTALLFALAAGIATMVSQHAAKVPPRWSSQPPPAVHSQIMHTGVVILYGEIGGAAPLEYFVSPQLAPACQMLREQEFSKVIPLFYQDLQAHPDSMGDFVGLAQASPSWRHLALKKLEKALAKDPNSSVLQFEVGTLLLYDWDGMDPNAGRPYPGPFPRAEALIQAAWHSSNKPIVGLMYNDITHQTHAVNITPPVFFADIEEGIISAAAGARAYGVYQRAEQAGWTGPLPTPDLTPRADLGQLMGVLIEQRSYARGHAKSIHADGTVVILKRAEPEKAAYLNGWLDLVREALGTKPSAPRKK